VGIPQVIGLSTDKACSPLNTYGLTKALMERIFAEANRWGGTQFATVRYGNVVGSTGSVIPLFYQQLDDFGELHVTDKNMTRFWISVEEAIDLISYAVSKRKGTIIYRCGAMKVIDLAELIANGKPIKVTGIRPGERLDERLLDYSESQHCEQEGDYYLLYPPTGKGNGVHEPWTYLSSAPAHWISKKEMATMIEDARGV
jgi:FlaA1/EpsC-like NDP-sugar epimerase